MSQQRDLFEAELRKPQPNWEVVIDNLNALAMFEMLPALAPLTAALRTQIAGKARSILETQRGWSGAGDRIDFAPGRAPFQIIRWTTRATFWRTCCGPPTVVPAAPPS